MTEVEICVSDAAGVSAARAGGADRAELCCALELGGLTPSAGAVEAGHAVAGDVFVTALVRPRPGDFVYDSLELRTMERDVARLAALADALDWASFGFTIGALTWDAALDVEAVRRLLAAAGGRRVVFHKAFDTVVDPERALDRLAELGVEAVLTSGGGGACVEHLDVLARLVRGPLCVTAAGGVRPANVVAVAATGVQRVHLRAPRRVASGSAIASEYDTEGREVTDPDLVAEVAALLRAEGRR